MLVRESRPPLGGSIPKFPHPNAFRHQRQFFECRDGDIIFQAPTCSGKTDAVLFSFLEDYLSAPPGVKRKALYLAPTRLLLQGQFANIVDYLNEYAVPSTILQGGMTYAGLFNKLMENDFIISSPDILYYMLLRKSRTQHIRAEYELFMASLHAVILDEIHLYDTFTLFNIDTLLKIVKKLNAASRLYLLSATMNLGGIIDLSSFQLVNGVSCTHPVRVKSEVAAYTNTKTMREFVRDYLSQRHLGVDDAFTVYVGNNVQRVISLHRQFPGSALLIGRVHQSDQERHVNLSLCKLGRLTFSTNVFRQGVDIDVVRLITEDVATREDVVQTFGRVGRHSDGEFLLLARSKSVCDVLNADRTVSRSEFEAILSDLYRPMEHDLLSEMMRALWYKVYEKSRLQDMLAFLITPEVEALYRKWQDFLPDAGFREPYPQAKYEQDTSTNIFDILRTDLASYLVPSSDAFFVAELDDKGRYRNCQFRYRQPPVLSFTQCKRWKETNFFNLQLNWNGISFDTNAMVSENQHEYPFRVKQMGRSFREYSFKPCVFFSGEGIEDKSWS
ncbi:MAG: DEAD/DEAH box helicase [Chloroflexi bacterium]|nr:DEAD/DEAH box helicase [Chloroflexota bacterium]